jgi:FtsP/CotA-like multicopper oxidase with cupredoxin domain
MERRVDFAAVALIWSLTSPIFLSAHQDGAGDAALPGVLANDNRKPAGTLEGGSLVLKLRASAGVWRPEGDSGPALRVESLGEESGSLQVPAPLIRVPEGTEVVASVRNDPDVALQVHGLCAHDGLRCAALDIPAVGSRDVRFTAGRAGTYHYWASTTGMPLSFRTVDAALSGAFIVDSTDAKSNTDRVLVITEWSDLTREQLRQLVASDDVTATFLAMNPRSTFLPGPTLALRRGEPVEITLVNHLPEATAIHWHGMELESYYDGVHGWSGAGTRVTPLIEAGRSFTVRFTPPHAGTFIYHTHLHDEHQLTSGMYGASRPGAGRDIRSGARSRRRDRPGRSRDGLPSGAQW